MMNKLITRLLALVLALVLCLACGCSKEAEVVIEPMEPEEVYTFGYDFLGGKDNMIISGFFGPQPQILSHNGNTITETLRDDVMANIAEAGINHISYTPWNILTDRNQSLIKKLLALGEKYGVGISLYQTYDFNIKGQDDMVAEYRKYPAFTTVFVQDEPSGLEYFANPAREIANFAGAFKSIKELGYTAYGNLYPIYDYGLKEQYEDYVDRYIELCDPTLLMYDHYVFDNNTFQTYFYNMSIIREKATAAKIPWVGFLQTGTDWTSHVNFDTPTEYQMHWNANNYLCAGAKSIQYYVLIQNPYQVSHDEYMDKINRIGILGTYGNKTRRWQIVKDINAQAHAVDHVLMNSVNKGVLVNGKIITGMLENANFVLKGQSWRELKDFDGETMVGCFNYNGKSAFYVMNASYEYAQHITFDFHNEYKLSVIQNTEEKYFKTNSLTLDMRAGEGALIVVEE